MRRGSVFDSEHRRRLAFWTNNWVLPTATVAELYPQRWQIELFFRWIKQNLRIRAFFGASPNAIQVQLWSAICTYLCVAITRKRLHLPQNLTTVLQIVSVHALHKVPLAELLAETDITPPPEDIPEQLTFSDL